MYRKLDTPLIYEPSQKNKKIRTEIKFRNTMIFANKKKSNSLKLVKIVQLFFKFSLSSTHILSPKI